jgi:hypothetical protein
MATVRILDFNSTPRGMFGISEEDFLLPSSLPLKHARYSLNFPDEKMLTPRS